VFFNNRRHPLTAIFTLGLLLSTTGCAQRTVPSDYQRGLKLAANKDDDAALKAFQLVLKDCGRRADECNDSHLRVAELGARKSSGLSGVAGYLLILDHCQDPNTNAEALLRAGRIAHSAIRQYRRARRIWMRAIVEYPKAPATKKALRRWILSLKRHSPEEFIAQLEGLVKRRKDSPLREELLSALSEAKKNR
jgi:TolA-binding protein